MKYKLMFLVALSWCLFSCGGESKVNGEMFVVTRGAGNYKLGAVQVKFFQKSRIEEIEKRGETPAYDRLRTDAEATTNADGKFTAKMPRGEYFAIAEAERTTFNETEKYGWKVPFKADGSEMELLLSNQNMLH